MKRLKLKDCIPRKKKPSDARSLAATLNRDLDNWEFNHIIFTEHNKRELLALMIEIIVLVLVSTTCYSFGGRLFRQIKGLGIGLRASAALARLAMCNWDSVWGYMQNRLGLKIRLFVDMLTISD